MRTFGIIFLIAIFFYESEAYAGAKASLCTPNQLLSFADRYSRSERRNNRRAVVLSSSSPTTEESATGVRMGPGIAALVTDASACDFSQASILDQVAGWGTVVAAVGTVGASDVVPAPLRLLLASIMIFANFEYCFHRWVMHAEKGTLQHELFGPYQELHITHHIETLDDMGLQGGQETDPRHIYFSGKTTLSSVVISSLILTGLDTVFHLGFTCQDVVATSALVALFHTSVWQTLHADIHAYTTEYADGLPRVDLLSTSSPYTRWMIANHVGHHVVNGKGNYNIVFPGPDYLWGTCYHPDR